MMIDLFEHEGIEYAVDDVYCPNPDCDCHEVHLRFLRCSPMPDGGVLATDWFQATLALEDRLESIECATATRGEAKAIFRAWRKTTAVLLDDLAWRYWKVKDIAQRSLAAAGKSPRRKQLPRGVDSSPNGILSDTNSRRDQLLPDTAAFLDRLSRDVDSPRGRRVGRNEDGYMPWETADRLEELLNEHQHRYDRGADDLSVYVRFKRGMVEEIYCSAETFLKAANRILERFSSTHAGRKCS